MDSMEITNEVGRKFRVQIVRKGDRWGLEKCLTHDEDVPLVEFYDLSYPAKFGAEGQFVSNYNLTTLLKEKRGIGLDLQGDVDVWKIDGETMVKVHDWLKTIK